VFCPEVGLRCFIRPLLVRDRSLQGALPVGVPLAGVYAESEPMSADPAETSRRYTPWLLYAEALAAVGLPPFRQSQQSFCLVHERPSNDNVGYRVTEDTSCGLVIARTA
jgi:hypothetical protein